MLELKGKYNTAKIFTDVIDEASISQIMFLLNQEFVFGSKIRLMPDVHAGSGCTIGTTMTIRDKVVPNLAGVDIGCGMECVELREREIDLEKLDQVIHEKIPAGFQVRDRIHHNYYHCTLDKLRCIHHINVDRAEKSLGTLGGGNHFIEANRDENGTIYLVVHTGSRHLGLEVAQYYQTEGYRALNSCSAYDKKLLIEQYKREGRSKEIQSALKTLENVKRASIPKELAYVEGKLFDDYIHDMQIVQDYAVWNRKTIVEEILNVMDLMAVSEFTTIHNYIDIKAMILRKGAVSAKLGERLIIPINMRDGSLICKGKGNEDWNESAPHGAGRLMSRSKAKEAFTVDEFKEQMDGIYTTSVGADTLDECPMAYKRMEDIVGNIADTVHIEKIIKPIYNFKVSGN